MGFGLSASLPCCFSAFLSSAAAAQEPTLDVVLARAGTYVVEFQRSLSGIVAEEHYRQDVRIPTTMGSASRLGPAVTHRELRSDLLLVKPVGSDRWMQFRDVFEVDDKPVRDRSERLMDLFVAPSSATASQAERIVNESTRFNIGNVERTVNVPVFALMILDPANQSRFAFKRVDRRNPQLGRPAGSASDTAWVLDYKEVEPQTMIRTTNGRDLPARGRFWIEPDTGRIVASELIAEDTAIMGTIDVQYQIDPSIGLVVPLEMRERYDIRRGGSRVDGVATYSRFRQFQVKVDEKIAPIVKQ
jgi:hypothetical protein